ncbi:P44-84 outer membrane protein, N-terminal fragment, partial [Anaplasma phagocytophilum str. HZ]
REDEADTVYLLAKELAYDVVTGQTDNLTAALAKTSGKDIVQFANAVKISAPKIDKQVCVTKQRKGWTKFGEYSGETSNLSTECVNKVTVCGMQALGNADTTGAAAAETLKDFVEKTLKGDKNWPTSTTASGKGPAAETNDNAEAP